MKDGRGGTWEKEVECGSSLSSDMIHDPPLPCIPHPSLSLPRLLSLFLSSSLPPLGLICLSRPFLLSGCILSCSLVDHPSYINRGVAWRDRVWCKRDSMVFSILSPMHHSSLPYFSPPGSFPSLRVKRETSSSYHRDSHCSFCHCLHPSPSLSFHAMDPHRILFLSSSSLSSFSSIILPSLSSHFI